MRPIVVALTALLSVTSARAGWEAVEGGVTVIPDATNSTILTILLHCLDGNPALDVYSLNDGPILPADNPQASADYFYKKGAVQAKVDGVVYPLAAAGSDIAVVLFSEGTEAESYLAPLDPAFGAALKAGQVLELGFDVTPASAPDGTAYDTWARFSIGGTAETVESAVPCL